MVAPDSIFTLPRTGRFLIEANAGSGKTWQIAMLYVWQVAMIGRTVEEIVVVSYTNSACDELHERILMRLQTYHQTLQAFIHHPAQIADENALVAINRRLELPAEALPLILQNAGKALDRLSIALSAQDRVQVMTLHKYFYRLLQSHALDLGESLSKTIIEEEDHQRLQKTACQEAWLLGQNPDSFPTEEIAIQNFFAKIRADSPHFFIQQFFDQFPSPESLEQSLRNLWGLSNAVIDLPQTPDWQRYDFFAQSLLTIQEVVANEGAIAQSRLLAQKLNGVKYKTSIVERAFSTLRKGLESGLISHFWNHPAIQKDIGKLFLSRIGEHNKFVSINALHPLHRLLEEILPDWWAWQNQILSWLWAKSTCALFSTSKLRFEKKLSENNLITFDQIIQKLFVLTHSEAGLAIGKNIQEAVWLVDEFQDTDACQWAILKSLQQANGHQDERLLVAVGDPKQSIYNFRGADIYAYLRAREEMSAPPIVLARNYRSTPKVVAGINACFSESAFLHPQLSYHPSVAWRPNAEDFPINDQPCAVVAIPKMDSAKSQKDWVIAHCLHTYQTLAAQRPDLTAAILVDTNWQGEQIAQSAWAQGITVSFDSAKSSPKPYLLMWWRLLNALQSTYGRKKIAALTLTPWIEAWDPEDWQAWAHPNETTQRLDQTRSKIEAWREVWIDAQNGGLWALWQSLLSDGLLERLSAEGYHQQDVRALYEIAMTLIEHSSQADEQLWWLHHWLHERLPYPQSSSALKAKDSGLTITTLHKAKGRQWQVVFCPFVETFSDATRPAKIEPKYFAGESWHYSLAPLAEAPYREIATIITEQARQEAVRRFYVILTRAELQLFVYLRTDPPPDNDKVLIRQSLRTNNQHLIAPLLSDLTSTKNAGAWQLISPEESFFTEEDIPRGAFALDPIATPAWQSQPKTIPDSWQTPMATSFTALWHSRMMPTMAMPTQIQWQAGDDENETEPRSNIAGNSAPSIGGKQFGIQIHQALAELIHRRKIDKGLRVMTTAIDQAIDRAFPNRQHHALAKTLISSFFAEPLGSWLGNATTSWQPDDEASEWAFTLYWSNHSKLGHWQSALETLSLPPLALAECGYLRGSIDWLFVHDHRYWIVDFKTNRLPDYQISTIEQTVRDQGYILQAAIYQTVVHQYLQAHLPRYDPQRHLGGVAFIFLRGLIESEKANYADPMRACYRLEASALPINVLSEVFRRKK